MNSFLVERGDCAPYHYEYIQRVKDADISELLETQRDRFASMIASIPEERGNFAYAPGKWTIKQVLQHVIDTERIFAFRLLALARGETQPIPGFEQDEYAAAVDLTDRTLTAIHKEFITVRDASITLIESLTPEMLHHRGTISGYSVLAGALPYILTGHVEHHVAVLKSHYAV